MTPETRRALIVDALKIVVEGDSEATQLARADAIAAMLEREAAAEIVERRGDRYIVRQVLGFVLNLNGGKIGASDVDLRRIYDGLSA